MNAEENELLKSVEEMTKSNMRIIKAIMGFKIYVWVLVVAVLLQLLNTAVLVWYHWKTH